MSHLNMTMLLTGKQNHFYIQQSCPEAPSLLSAPLPLKHSASCLLHAKVCLLTALQVHTLNY